MTETEQKTCKCAEPELRVYSTTYTLEHKVQYCKCLKCNLTAEAKRTPTALAQRVAALELMVLELRKLFRA